LKDRENIADGATVWPAAMLDLLAVEAIKVFGVYAVKKCR
jgi:hypothetical protein